MDKKLNNKGEEFPGIKRENPFDVPRGYFSGLPGRVMEQISEEEEQDGPKGLLKLKPLMKYAAIFVIAIAAGWIILNYSSSIDSTGKQELSAYQFLIGEVNTLSVDDLVAEVSAAVLEDDSALPSSDIFEFVDEVNESKIFSEEIIVEYLLEEYNLDELMYEL